MSRRIDWTKAAALPAAELDRLLDEDRDEVDDNPEATADQIAAAQPGQRRPGQRGPGRRLAKVVMTVRVEPEILAAWRGSGAGWQSRVNELLRKAAPRKVSHGKD